MGQPNIYENCYNKGYASALDAPPVKSCLSRSVGVLNGIRTGFRLTQ
ncbi:MAG: hypothetical protein AVDCRST_MAG86-2971 [uncultured Truepera sp.]|uniref:Uncharacterized protein n=1 Tax=uncultured Truepera sp. TaxID=543023 RepID=A0A6J4VL93_9DEIN|nr:MAG: hypothetical protein AVDCRST_MAG86-2971 [uncultured Truepera sp.]